MAERFTRSTQNAVGVIPCGFESHLAHKMPKSKLPIKEFVWAPDLAYTIGLLVTDGCLSNDGRHIVMRSSDTELLETFKECLGINNKVGETRNGDVISYRVQFGDVQFYNCLL